MVSAMIDDCQVTPSQLVTKNFDPNQFHDDTADALCLKDVNIPYIRLEPYSSGIRPSLLGQTEHITSSFYCDFDSFDMTDG